LPRENPLNFAPESNGIKIYIMEQIATILPKYFFEKLTFLSPETPCFIALDTPDPSPALIGKAKTRGQAEATWIYHLRGWKEKMMDSTLLATIRSSQRFQ
jgi:hypothetical protein